MPLLTGEDGVVVPAAFLSESTQRLPLGFRGRDEFGRSYRYVKAGAVDLVVGNAIQAPAQITNHQQLTPSVAAIGAGSITLTPTATSITAQDYADGLAVIDTAPGLGYAYRIGSHPAWTSGTLVLTLAPEDTIIVALSAISRVSMIKNPYSAVIQCPVTTSTGVCIGGAIFIITATQFGWVQCGGQGAALITGTPAVGQMLTSVGAAAGALAIVSGTLPVVAQNMVTGVDQKVQPVFWNIS